MSELSEQELFEKYPDEVKKYIPFVLLSVEQGKAIQHTTEMRISTENARITIAMPLDMMMELLRICIQRYPYLIL